MRYIKSFVLIIILFLAFTSQASAHVLKTDGAIGAVLHVDPNDEPKAGEQASFFFEFKDRNGKFDPKNCDCTFKILENGNPLFTQGLFDQSSEPSLSSASVFYTFEKGGVYQIQVIGKPASDGDFQSFRLNYDIRVENADGKPKTETNFLSDYVPYMIVGLAVAFLLVYYWRNRR